MFSVIRKHLNPTSVVAFVALIFAMSGGAFAMNSSGSPAKPTAAVGSGAGGNPIATAAKSKAKPKAKAGPRGPAGPAGKNGANGAAGAQGPQGPQGPAGPAGAKGETGTPGTNGTDGTDGTNGTNGATGAAGSPWTVGGLPKGASERGTWTISGDYKAGEYVTASMSFSVPLAEPLEGEQVHFIALGEGETEASEAEAIKNGECTGTYAKPGAASGQLCVFESLPGELAGAGELSRPPAVSINSPETRTAGAGVSGAYVFGIATFTSPATEGDVIEVGDWVVTG